MKHTLFLFFTALATACVIGACGASRSDASTARPPDYERIAQLVQVPGGAFNLDSLMARFDSLDTTLSVDDLRCLYYGGSGLSVAAAASQYKLLLGRMGRHAGAANDAWTRYQLLLSAVWSTGDGSPERPLHAATEADADYLRSVEGVECVYVRP